MGESFAGVAGAGLSPLPEGMSVGSGMNARADFAEDEASTIAAVAAMALADSPVQGLRPSKSPAHSSSPARRAAAAAMAPIEEGEAVLETKWDSRTFEEPPVASDGWGMPQISGGSSAVPTVAAVAAFAAATVADPPTPPLPLPSPPKADSRHLGPRYPYEYDNDYHSADEHFRASVGTLGPYGAHAGSPAAISSPQAIVSPPSSSMEKTRASSTAAADAGGNVQPGGTMPPYGSGSFGSDGLDVDEVDVERLIGMYANVKLSDKVTISPLMSPIKPPQHDRYDDEYSGDARIQEHWHGNVYGSENAHVKHTVQTEIFASSTTHSDAGASGSAGNDAWHRNQDGDKHSRPTARQELFAPSTSQPDVGVSDFNGHRGADLVTLSGPSSSYGYDAVTAGKQPLRGVTQIREELVRGVERLERGKDGLVDATHRAIEANTMGENLLATLQEQRESLVRSGTELKGVGAKMKKNEKLVNDMNSWTRLGAKSSRSLW